MKRADFRNTLFFRADLIQGLSAQERSRRLARDGRNVLTPPRQLPEWVKFLRAMVGGFSLLLLLGSLLSFIAYLIPVCGELFGKVGCLSAR